MDESRINLDVSVLVGLDLMSPDEREVVLNAINSLETFSPDQPIESNIQKYAPPNMRTFYLLHASPDYRVIFEINDQDEIEVKDLFRKERLEVLAGKKG